ncbi:MAG: hypothetical protein SGCHY_000120, partial [Lobulomycetales sp.]
MNLIVALLSVSGLATAQYNPYQAPRRPSEYPSTDATLFITGNLLADPLVQDAWKFVQERVPAEYLDLEPSIFNPATPNAPTYPPGQMARGCLWNFGACVQEEDSEYFFKDIIGCPQENQWGYTFDDGPTMPWSETTATPGLVQRLDQRGIKASFYVVGYHVNWDDESRAYTKTMADNGHEIALHTWSHKPLTSLTNEQIIAELLYTESIIYETTGVAPLQLRPPYGDVDNRVRAIARALGFHITLWTNDSSDFMVPLPTLLQTVASWYRNSGPGMITLQHDGDLATIEKSQASIDAFPVTLPKTPIP